MVYPHNGIICSDKKDGTADTYKMVESKHIMLSGKSQSQKTIYYMISLISNIH